MVESFGLAPTTREDRRARLPQQRLTLAIFLSHQIELLLHRRRVTLNEG